MLSETSASPTSWVTGTQIEVLGSRADHWLWHGREDNDRSVRGVNQKVPREVAPREEWQVQGLCVRSPSAITGAVFNHIELHHAKHTIRVPA